MTAQPSSPFDFSPMLKTYMESVELWKKNYENMMKSAKDIQGALGAKESAQAKPSSAGASASDAALLNWRKSGEEVFKRFVENQIELCHFFGSRWEQYLKLPEQISQCRSLTELGRRLSCGAMALLPGLGRAPFPRSWDAGKTGMAGDERRHRFSTILGFRPGKR